MKKGFDWYLINKWSDVGTYPADDILKMQQIRKNACHKLNLAVRGKKVADPHTIRKWFGLGGLSKPGRETIFKLAFALPLSVAETQDYLVNGLMVPGIQINDYQEFIFLYGLENHLTYDFCQDMVELFEKNLAREVHFIQEKHTKHLWTFYEQNKNLPPDDFFLWMDKNACLFKGYSKTTLDCFVSLKNAIIKSIRQKAEEEVLFLLEGTTFYKETKNRNLSKKDYPEAIRRYLHNEMRRNQSSISPQLYESIRWYSHIAFHSKGNDSALLAEVYSFTPDLLRNTGIHPMTHKYLSQLLHVAEQKEAQIRLTQQLACTSEAREQKELKRQMRLQKQRCHLIHREDLLPLLHYVGQEKYLSSLEQNKKSYQKDDAIQAFTSFANTILSACQMVPISGQYELDAILLDSFREDDMYSLSDMIEEIKGIT